jgi:NADH:ubiquinone oxidoreductase subunit F (NADH-binding)
VEEIPILLRYAGKINPEKAEEYIKVGGYQGLEKARGMKRKDIIEEIIKSGLRGRGGAAFNTGLKLSFVPAQAENKYIICNLDEGEPGTYKDRTLCEKNVQAVIEGIAICATAINARQAYIYCRAEYFFLKDLIIKAIASAKESGVLDNLEIEVRMGAGAYVCGEETALIESLEGKRGEPRYKPPFPTDKGLWQYPTVIINVETLANLPFIMAYGAERFAGIGAPNYPGTKLITFSGDIKNTGCYEAPTNYTLKDLIYKIGGGIKNGHRLKAIQMGGSSGPFIPEKNLDTAIDYDSLAEIGAFLGSGAVLVLDETRDIVDVTLTVLRFFEHESCGKCVPCREGTFRAREIFEKILQGKAQPKDLGNLLELLKVMENTSLCGLGQSVNFPVKSGVEHFKEDYFKYFKQSSQRGPN